MPDNSANGHSTTINNSKLIDQEPSVDIAAIATAISILLTAIAIAILALAAAFRRRASTRNDAYRVLQLLLRFRHRE